MATVFENDDPSLRGLLSCKDFAKAALDYLIFQFRKRLDMKNVGEAEVADIMSKSEEERLAQIMIDNSDHHLRMYGSAREFAEQMRIYRNFPGSHKYFAANTMNPYFTTPTLYQSLKNEKYICKLDLFVYLHNLTLHKIPDLEHEIFSTLLAIFLKSQEEKISKKFEFVRYDPKIFEEIANELGKLKNSVADSVDDEFTMPSVQMSGFSIDKAYGIWKKLIPTDWKEEEYKIVRELVVATYNDVEPEARSSFYDWLFFNGENLFKTFQNIIGKRPEMFLLHSETKNNKMPITVRLFEDGSHQFIMKAELYQAINIKSENPESSIHNFDAIEMNDVFKMFGDRVHNIEFIRTPILRAKHKSVPIKGPNSEEFCMLAVDALFDLLKHFIFGVKFFQKISDMKTELFLPLLKKLEVIFDPKVEHRYFLQIGPYLIHTITLYSILKDLDSTLAKDVRNAKKDGFTVENLKNELKHLGLTETFPEITDHAEVVYEEVMRVKKEEYLRTCDLFDAIEHCQLICIFNQAPNLRKFLHNQKSCGRVLTLKCDSCIVTPSNNSSSENLDSQNVPKIPERIDAAKPTISAEVCEESDQKETMINYSPENNESGICEECQQRFVMLNVTETKLRALEDIIKNLENELSEKNEELIEMNNIDGKIVDRMGQKMIEKMNRIKELEEKITADAEIFNENEALKKNVLQLEDNNNELKEFNSKFKVKVSDIEKNMTDVKNKSEKIVQEKTMEIKKLKDNNTKISKENDGLKLKISKLENKESQLKEKNSKLEIKVTEAEKNMIEEKRKNGKIVEDQKKELKNLKENHAKISKENDGLKLKIWDLEDIRAQLKEENSKKESIFEESQRSLQGKVSCLEEDLCRKDQTFHKTQTDLQKRISYLESTLVSEKQKSENLNKKIIESKEKSTRIKANEEQKWMDERRRFEEDVIEKAKQINEFHTSNMQRMAETNGKMIQQILDSLTNAPTMLFDNSAHSTSSLDINSSFMNEQKKRVTDLTMHNQQNVRHHTPGYIPPHLRRQRVSNNFLQTSNASTSDNILNSCEPSTSSSVNINSSFMNEQTITDLTDLGMYRSSPSGSNIGNSAQSVTRNECPTSLVKIPEKQRDEKDEKPINPQTTKSTEDTNSLQSVGAPEAPNLVDNNPISSSAVKNSLTPSKNLDKQKWSDQKPKTNSELEDSECLICFIDMKSIDKTIKCNQCRRRFHSNCASQWLKVKCECPACRGRLLDPHEFPSLS